MSERFDDADATIDLVGGLPPCLFGSEAGIWVRSLEKLMEHPGVWARVTLKIPRKYVGSCVNAINRRRYTQLPPGIWRAARRGGDLYVCFCGDAKK